MSALALVIALATAGPSLPPVPAAGPSMLPGPSPVPSVTPLPGGATASPAPASSPGAEPSPLPTFAPSPGQTAAPSPSATPVYKYRVLPSPNPSAAAGAPAILEVDLNDKQLTPHGKIAIRVLTSTDVVKVVTRSNGREGPLVQTAPGEFIGNGSIPGIPFIARGWKVNIEFVATTADGRTASVKVPVTLG